MSDIEDKLMAKRETEEKRDKKSKDHEDRLREINDNLRRKNSTLIVVPESTERTEDEKVYLNKSYLKTFLILEGKQAFRSRK